MRETTRIKEVEMNTEIIELIKGCKKELVECGLYENSRLITIALLGDVQEC